MQPMTSHSSVITFHQAERGRRSRWNRVPGFGLVPVDYGDTLPKARMLRDAKEKIRALLPKFTLNS